MELWHLVSLAFAGVFIAMGLLAIWLRRLRRRVLRSEPGQASDDVVKERTESLVNTVHRVQSELEELRTAARRGTR